MGFFRLRCNQLLLLMTVMLMAVSSHAYAEESGKLEMNIGSDVISCTAQIPLKNDFFSMPMKDGIAMSTSWHIQMGKVRKYWLNENIADITVSHRVTPDLLTHSWLLTDSSSGISRRVYQMDDAIHFLIRLEDFSVLDRSLLAVNIPYEATVSVNVHAGVIKDVWWAKLWNPSAITMQQDFSLP